MAEKEYINRATLRKRLLDGADYADEGTFLTVLNVLDTEPAADVEQVRHGEWIWTETGKEDNEQFWRCSCCGGKTYYKTNHCEDCGAKMDRGESNG